MGQATEKTRAAFARALERTEQAVRFGLQAVGARLIELSPVGDPALWKNPHSAPPGYEGGQFRSNWNYSGGAVDRSTTDLTGVRTINGLAEAQKMIGVVHYMANSLPYAQALEFGHSTQAPVGIMAVVEIEAPDLATEAARRAAR
jgi:hypothetical protein